MTAPIIYVESDLPEGMTLGEWRRLHCTRRRSWRTRLASLRRRH